LVRRSRQEQLVPGAGGAPPGAGGGSPRGSPGPPVPGEEAEGRRRRLGQALRLRLHAPCTGCGTHGSGRAVWHARDAAILSDATILWARRSNCSSLSRSIAAALPDESTARRPRRSQSRCRCPSRPTLACSGAHRRWCCVGCWTRPSEADMRTVSRSRHASTTAARTRALAKQGTSTRECRRRTNDGA
jgi:hypothetical protein